MTEQHESSENLDARYYQKVFPRFLITLITGYFVGQFASSFIYIYYFGDDINVMLDIVQRPLENLSLGKPFLLIQGVFSLFCFMVLPLLFISKVAFPIEYNWWKGKQEVVVSSFSSTIMLMIVAVPLSSLLAEWNKSMPVPDFLSGFEAWALESEKHMQAMTQVITHFESLPHFLGGVVIIGLLAAVGEELTFRGLLQPMLIHILKNKHLGIVLTAFVFGVIHMQFFSFLPRFVLGIVFGYLYLYSKNLWIPIGAHFVNNSLSLLIVYHYGFSESDAPISIIDENPLLFFGILSAFIGGIFWHLKKLWAKNTLT